MALCFSVLGLFVGESLGTTVVIVRTENYLLIGVDSHVSAMNPETGVNGYSGCKIIKAGRFFVVTTGIFAEGGPSGFNAYTLAEDISHREQTPAAIANHFEKVAVKPYSRLLRRFHKNDPSGFDKFCNNKECLQLLVAGYDGNPSYALRRFRVALRHGVPEVEKLPDLDCPGSCPTPSSTIIIGDNIKANLLNQSPNFWTQHGVLSGIEELIRGEASAHGDEVGGPISILALDKSGPHWMPGYQGTCPDFK